MFQADSVELDRSTLEAIAHSATILSGSARPCRLATDGRWGRHRLLPLYLDRAPSRDVRRFVRDRLFWSPSFARSAATAPMAIVAASRSGVRALTSPRLAFDPPLDDSIVIQVGARRVRAFDLETRQTVIVDIPGRAPTVGTELAARRVGAALFFAPLIHADQKTGYLLEEIVDGQNLARHAPWRRRRAIMERALSALAEWAGPSTETRDQRAYATELADELRMQHSADESLVTILVERTARGIPVRVGPSHGDLQQGNILYDRYHDQLRIVDFEECASRSSSYDRAVLLAGLRWLASPRSPATIGTYLTKSQDRLEHTTSLSTAEIAVVLLEELIRWGTNRRDSDRLS